MREIRIGSRESALAMAQTREVADFINSHCNNVTAAIVPMKTTGDVILDRTLDQVGGKGLFVKELDRALLEGRTQLSVHSLKDLPAEVDERLPILGYLKAQSAMDVLVLPKGCRELDWEKPIGTSSKRRARQFRALHPHCTVKSVRGNLQTRLARLDGGEYGALILAKAGLVRLGLEDRISQEFLPEEMVPAGGQGIIAVQGVLGEDYEFLSPLFSEEARRRALCERAFLQTIGGGCSTPVGVYCQTVGEKLQIWGYFCNEETDREARGSVVCDWGDGNRQSVELAERLRRETLPSGGLFGGLSR